jgi:decaprenylphospho-beta-D-erythro-pentofuranosid-2-ulose 2-reductase
MQLVPVAPCDDMSTASHSTSRHLVVFGATSLIAQHVAALAAAQGDRLFLVGRDAGKLAIVAGDLAVRFGGRVETAAIDLLAEEAVAQVLARARAALGRIDIVLVAHGWLPDQDACVRSWSEGERALRVNFLSPAMIAEIAGTMLAREGGGCVAVIGSVAGDRGRSSNYYYGAAKGGLERFTQGLRGRLARQGVRVLLIKPGPVDTPMTQHLKRGLLWATPAGAARRIFPHLAGGADVLYVPFFWRWIMFVIRCIPERFFKKLSL